MDMKKISCVALLGVVWSSFAFAQCEPERRAYDIAGESCHRKWRAANDIAECKNEERAAAAAKLQQCFRDINAGKRER
ncbi:hypothetical protein PGB34_01105 [Xenophilus arseniciresistens]|uniref:Uncharacterized protein n=1 Tax=Xenophilus arseniciresistens TaxID=1283306 RepID=A0AAE3SXH5_9BURK|nr:hypothetical protein [Xenophilus arseniciresistens]MDA7414949.1 hypothetical protein [Xenophilus arseniciresistens]